MVKHVYLGKKDKVVTHVTIVAMGTNTPRSREAAERRSGIQSQDRTPTSKKITSSHDEDDVTKDTGNMHKHAASYVQKD